MMVKAAFKPSSATFQNLHCLPILRLVLGNQRGKIAGPMESHRAGSPAGVSFAICTNSAALPGFLAALCAGLCPLGLLG